jgi:hypothetical protein
MPSGGDATPQLTNLTPIAVNKGATCNKQEKGERNTTSDDECHEQQPPTTRAFDLSSVHNSRFLLDRVRITTGGPVEFIRAFLKSMNRKKDRRSGNRGRHGRSAIYEHEGVRFRADYNSHFLRRGPRTRLSLSFDDEPSLNALRSVVAILRSHGLVPCLSEVEFTIDLYTDQPQAVYETLRQHLTVGHIREPAICFKKTTYYVNHKHRRTKDRSRARRDTDGQPGRDNTAGQNSWKHVVQLYLAHLKHGGPSRVRLELTAVRNKLKDMGVPDLEALAAYPVARLLEDFHLGLGSFERMAFEKRLVRWHQSNLPHMTPRAMVIARDWCEYWCEQLDDLAKHIGLMNTYIAARSYARQLGGWHRLLKPVPAPAAALFWKLFRRGRVEECVQEKGAF